MTTTQGQFINNGNNSNYKNDEGATCRLGQLLQMLIDQKCGQRLKDKNKNNDQS